MGLPELRDEQFAMLAGTTAIGATVKKRLRDNFVANYQSEFDAILERKGLTDTAQNRGKFLAHKMIDYVRQGSNARQKRVARESAPAPTLDAEMPDFD